MDPVAALFYFDIFFGLYLVGLGGVLLVVDRLSPRRGLRRIALGIIALGLLCWMAYVLCVLWILHQVGGS